MRSLATTSAWRAKKAWGRAGKGLDGRGGYGSGYGGGWGGRAKMTRIAVQLQQKQLQMTKTKLAFILTCFCSLFALGENSLASPGNTMQQKGNYWVCPGSADNRVIALDDIPESPGGAARLRRWETNMYRASVASLPLVSADAWIAIAKDEISDIDTVVSAFMSRDIKPPTSYTIKGYDFWKSGSYPQRSDRFVFQNSAGTELSIVFDMYHYTPYYGHALDGRGNKIDIHTNYRGASSLTCNSGDANITYKSVYPFKMRLTNQYGQDYDSPLLVLNVKYIIKPSYLRESSGFGF